MFETYNHKRTYDIEKPCLLSIWLDVLQQKHTSMRHRAIFTSYADEQAKDDKQTVD